MGWFVFLGKYGEAMMFWEALTIVAIALHAPPECRHLAPFVVYDDKQVTSICHNANGHGRSCYLPNVNTVILPSECVSDSTYCDSLEKHEAGWVVATCMKPPLDYNGQPKVILDLEGL